LISIIWLILVVTVTIHPELNIYGTASVLLIFLAAFAALQVIQFFASLVHRLVTLSNALANVPMTFNMSMTSGGKKYDQMKLKMEKEEPVAREGVATKMARKMLMVDKRTATQANLFSSSVYQ